MSTAAQSQELKGLQVQLAKEQAKLPLLQQELSSIQRDCHRTEAAIKSLQSRIATLQTQATEPVVSEHAMLRYLERVKGLDLAALRDEILGDGTAASIAFAQNGCIKKGGIHLIIRNNTVITVK